MKISGFSFVRNGILYGYPFIESIKSILPLCDEFIIAVGKSEDDTLDQIQAIGSPKIKIIETIWDDSLRTGGRILAQQTDIALKQVSGDWAFYLQADEVVHERDLDTVRAAAMRHLNDTTVEGFLFGYRHFYGSYRYVGTSRRWYRREIRVVRNGVGVHSWGDAQGFRVGNRKLCVKPVEATIYHYGWVKPARLQQQKQRTFNRLWHSDAWIEEHVKQVDAFEYSDGGKLALFDDIHPRVMQRRVQEEDWHFTYDERKVRLSIKDRILDWIERRTGYRVAEYKNYELL
jgi:glycosyltransferase involved in cell wall biosynthesis